MPIVKEKKPTEKKIKFPAGSKRSWYNQAISMFQPGFISLFNRIFRPRILNVFEE